MMNRFFNVKKIIPGQVKGEALIAKELNAKIELTSEVNTEIIGGMVLRLDDKQYDASVASQLKKIKQELLETELK